SQLAAVVEIEGGPDLVSQAFERIGGEIERRHRRELSQMRPCGQRSPSRSSDRHGRVVPTLGSRLCDSSADDDRRGSVTVKAAPAPSALATAIVPPSALPSSLVIQRPRPSPGCWRWPLARSK